MEAGTDANALGKLQRTTVRFIDAPAIVGIDELMEKQTRVARYEDVTTALQLGCITDQEAGQYREMIEEDVNIGTDLRDRIASVQADLLQADSADESA